MLRTINKYFLKIGIDVRISLFSLPCGVVLSAFCSFPAFQWGPIQELIPYSSKFFPCLERARWPTPFLRGSSDCCKWTFLFLAWTIHEWRGSKINGCVIHHSYYSRFMLWLKCLKVVLCSLGTTRCRMPTHVGIFTQLCFVVHIRAAYEVMCIWGMLE